MKPDYAPLPNPHRRLSPGCYALLFTPDQPYHGPEDNPADAERGVQWYPGSLRVVHYADTADGMTAVDAAATGPSSRIRISGDLYAAAPETPLPGYGEIPIHPRDDYRFYLRAIEVREAGDNAFIVTFETRELREGRWLAPNTIAVEFRWEAQQTILGRAVDQLTGEVRSPQGERLGTLEMTWVSNSLRRGVVEFDTLGDIAPPRTTEGGSELPPGSADPKPRCTWDKAFRPAGWEMEFQHSDTPSQPCTRVWAEFELQEALPALRDSTDTDREWRYHVFCVGELEDGGRGYKFDTRGTDKGSTLFESVVIAARYRFPEDAVWGTVQGRTLDSTPLYFRVAVHEVGHAMKLEHNFDTLGFMATTDTIQQAADSDVLAAVDWSFAPRDLERLRHWPDIVVRPGGTVASLPIPGLDADPGPHDHDEATAGFKPPGLQLTLSPLLDGFPLGAPVRLGLELRNNGPGPVRVPGLRLKAGALSGWVEHDGDRFGFLPLARGVDDQNLAVLEAGRSLTGSLSLLRGPDGPLFAQTGPCKVTARLAWNDQKQPYELSASATVVIHQAVDDAHRKVAARLLGTQDTLEGFAIGGDGFADGNQAINIAISNRVLKPHFAVIQLRRLLRDYGSVVGSLDQALQLLCESPARFCAADGAQSCDDATHACSLRDGNLCRQDRPAWILSSTEVRRLADLLRATQRRNRGGADLEKAVIATRIILGRLSPQVLDWMQSELSGSNPTPGHPVSARHGHASNGQAVVNGNASQGSVATAQGVLMRRLLPPPLAERFLREPAARNSAERSSPTAATRATPIPFVRQLEKFGLPPEWLGTLRTKLSRLSIADAEITDAALALVRAFHQLPFGGLGGRATDVRAALVANLVSNLIRAGVPDPVALFDAAVSPVTESSSIEELLRWMPEKNLSTAALLRLLKDRRIPAQPLNLEFARQVHAQLASDSTDPELLQRLRDRVAGWDAQKGASTRHDSDGTLRGSETPASEPANA